MEIYYMDTLIFQINTEKDDLGKVKIYKAEFLPFDIYLEESDDIDDRINNIVNFNSWCSSRVLTLDREYAKEIFNYYGFSQRLTDSDRAKIAISTRCLSLNDCFWSKESNETLTWEDVNLFDNSLENSIFEVALFGKTPTITNTKLINPDITTDGKAPKAWLREQNDFYLLKGNKNDSVQREIEASQILTSLGFENTKYDEYWFDNQKVSRCKCFTNKKVNLVRAEWFNIWCINHDNDIADYILKFQEQFDRMNLADYLIGNSDEHAQNWGFLYDNSFNILSINPLMDFDHAFESSAESLCLPTRLLGRNTTQLDEAVSIIKKHPTWIDTKIDLSNYKYGNFVKERLALLQSELNK